MLKVLFLTNIPSPYRVSFFNQLGKSCDLTVLFEKGFSDERDASWKNYNFSNFKGVFLKGKAIRTDMALSFEVLKYIKDKSFDKIICANAATPTGMLAIAYMKTHKIPYFIEGDGGFAKSGKGLKEGIKKYFIKGANGYFSTSSAHDEYYKTYGANQNKIYRYPFTSIKNEDILSSPPTAQEKDELRKELAITEKTVIVTVGRFIYRKGFDLLLNAAKDLPKSCGIYFIGGTATQEYTQIKDKLGLDNVHFIGFKLKDELNKYFKAADLFVLPTREDIWGLVVNEAMANALPVVTTDRCIAGLELVKNDENGYIVPINNEKMLAEKINSILQDEEKRSAMQTCSLNIVKEYTIEKMAARHLEIFNFN